MSRKTILSLALLFAVGIFFVGCGKPETAKTKTLCGGCGQIKGTELCCKEGVPKCDKCELAKGSPGCCKITKGTEAVLCGCCGEIKGSEACCK